MNAKRYFIIAGVITALMIYASIAWADEGTVWLHKIAEAEKVDHSVSTGTQTITTTTGKERTFETKSWSAEEGDIGLTEYLSPSRVKGDKILIRDAGDNIWYYMKRRDVTRHFTGNQRKQKAMGSDFSYEDMAMGDFEEDYTPEFLGFEDIDGTRCVKLKCVPTESGPSYDHIIIFADEENSLTRQIDYFDENGHLKSLFLTEFTVFGSHTVATNILMVSHREGSQTKMTIDTIDFDSPPSSSIFTKDALSREIN